MHKLGTQQLKEICDKYRGFPFINVLPEDAYKKQHIPGSDNIPLDSEDFVQRVEQKVQNKDQPVIVYCASSECDASPKAAEKLEDAGFSQVCDYEGGTEAWKEAGYPLEGATV